MTTLAKANFTLRCLCNDYMQTSTTQWTFEGTSAAASGCHSPPSSSSFRKRARLRRCACLRPLFHRISRWSAEQVTRPASPKLTNICKINEPGLKHRDDSVRSPSKDSYFTKGKRGKMHCFCCPLPVPPPFFKWAAGAQQTRGDVSTVNTNVAIEVSQPKVGWLFAM